MWIRFFFAILFLSSFLWANQPVEDVTPELIEKQLSEAEEEFEVAKKMFNPWYAGPLIAGSAITVPKGMTNIQPYLFITDTYAFYDSNRRSRNIPDILTYNPVFVYQMGLTNWLDFTISAQGVHNRQSGKSATNFGDAQIGVGFQLFKETSTRPAARFVIIEFLPTGKYEKLNPDKHGIDITGSGSYETLLGINMQKIFFWFPTHPMRLRLNLNYTMAAPVNVEGFNAYGGGFGTNGKVKPGNTFTADFAAELSLSQKWVIASDVIYIDFRRSNFSGKRGLDALGNKAKVGRPSRDQMSLAPAIQYNPNPNLGFLFGTWFTVRGRNAADFVSAVLTLTYTF